ncbi:MAG TPA: VOC family protein [Thermomicrobiales bacterium]|nr:VOC family protein [Thermomicrobiales bacterium]
MPYELDHVFICTDPGAPVAQRLIELGLVEGSPNVHPGQGTANRRFYFHNTMIELLYVTDEAELRSPLVQQIRLSERFRWRQTAACPFGICLRSTDAADPAPFATFDYMAPWLPEGTAIPMARGAMTVEPLLFIKPDSMQGGAATSEPVEHPLGLRQMTGVHVVSAGCELPSDSLRAVQRQGIVSVSQGEGHLLELTFDGGQRGKAADLRPELPLVVSW